MIFENIRNLREDCDKKQQEIADYLHIKQTTYSKYELGKINIPIEILIKLADYLVSWQFPTADHNFS